MRILALVCLTAVPLGLFGGSPTQRSSGLEVRLRLVARVQLPLNGSDLVVMPHGHSVYVTQEDGHVIIVDTQSHKVTASFSIPLQPRGLAVTPDGSTVYVGHDDGRLSAIDTRTKSVITHHVHGSALGPAVTPDGRYVYWPGCAAGLERLDRLTSALKTVRAGPCPTAVVAAPDGQTLWVSYQSAGPGGRSGHDAIAYFDQRTGELRGSITGLPQVGGPLALSSDGRHLLAHALDACSNPTFDHLGCPVVPSVLLHLIDTESHQTIRSVVFPGERVTTTHFAFSPAGRCIAIAGPKLRLLETATLTLLAARADAAWYSGVRFSADGKSLFALSQGPALNFYALE